MPALVRGRSAPHKPHKLHISPLASAGLDSGPGADEDRAWVWSPLPSMWPPCVLTLRTGGCWLGPTSAAIATSAPLLQLWLLRNSYSWQAAVWNTAWWSCFYSQLSCKRLLWVVLCFNKKEIELCSSQQALFITVGLNSNWPLIVSPIERRPLMKAFHLLQRMNFPMHETRLPRETHKISKRATKNLYMSSEYSRWLRRH